jgi:hypothetical protein
MLEWDNTARRGTKSIVFKEYSPEKFYLLNKILIDYTRSHYNESNRFIFINAWNEWGEGSYLEPDDKYGYSSINALSKALFNLTYISQNISNLNSTYFSKVIVQINLFNDDIINEIINKINNIPIKFDLFIIINSLERIELIENIKKNKNLNKYYIIMLDKRLMNTKRLFKIFNIISKQYKYICNINDIVFNKNNENLRYTFFNNLLGNENTVKDILSNFETYQKLGLIISETNSDISTQTLDIVNNEFINYILTAIYPGQNYKIWKKFIIGNIFWAKISSIYQIFNVKLYKTIQRIVNNEYRLIIENINIILLYFVKINGYYYKKIFKYN